MAGKPPSVFARLGAASENQRKRRAPTAATGAESTSPDRDSGASPAGAAKRARLQQAAPPKDAMARSRRLFGALMGHLGKAKAQIERDSALLQRQDARQLAAERKEQRQSRSLEERAKRAAAVLALEKALARTTAERKEQLARAELEYQTQTRQRARLAGFLQTVASPPVAYLPAKHTKETEDLVAAAKEAHEAKAQLAARAHETRVRDLEREFDAKLEQCRAQLAAAEQRVKQEEPAADGEGRAKAVETVKANGAKEKEQEVEDDDEMEGEAAAGAGAEEEEQAVEEQVAAVVEDAKATEDEATAHSLESSCSGGEFDDEKEATEEAPASPARGEEETTRTSVDVGSEAAVDTAAPAAPIDEQSAAEAPVEAAIDANASASPAVEQVAAPAIDASALKVTELREQLKQRGLDAKGLKAALVARLEDALRREVAA